MVIFPRRRRGKRKSYYEGESLGWLKLHRYDKDGEEGSKPTKLDVLLRKEEEHDMES